MLAFAKGKAEPLSDEQHEGVFSEAGFFESIENAPHGVIKSTHGVVVVGHLLADFGKIGEVTGNNDVFGGIEFGRGAPIGFSCFWIVERAVRVVGIDHEVERFVFLFAALEKLLGVIVIFFRAASGAELRVVVGKVPLEFKVGS